MIVDHYLSKVFTPKYNCWNFVQEVWQDITGVDLGDHTPLDKSASSFMAAALDFASTLQPLADRQDPCIVLMLRKGIQPHVGVYYQGRLLHLNARGAEYRPLDQITTGYPTVKYYK